MCRLQKKTEDSNGLLDRLDELVSTKHDTLDSVMNKLHGVLNARQVGGCVCMQCQSEIPIVP